LKKKILTLNNKSLSDSFNRFKYSNLEDKIPTSQINSIQTISVTDEKPVNDKEKHIQKFLEIYIQKLNLFNNIHKESYIDPNDSSNNPTKLTGLEFIKNEIKTENNFLDEFLNITDKFNLIRDKIQSSDTQTDFSKISDELKIIKEGFNSLIKNEQIEVSKSDIVNELEIIQSELITLNSTNKTELKNIDNKLDSINKEIIKSNKLFDILNDINTLEIDKSKFDILAFIKKFEQLNAKFNSLKLILNLLTRLLYNTNEDSKENIKIAIENISSKYINLKNTLLSFLNNSKTIDDFKTNVKNWFESKQDRVTGEYKRRTHIWLFWTGLLISILFNFDILNVIEKLYNDNSFLNTVSTNAGEALKDENKTFSPIDFVGRKSFKYNSVINPIKKFEYEVNKLPDFSIASLIEDINRDYNNYEFFAKKRILTSPDKVKDYKVQLVNVNNKGSNSISETLNKDKPKKVKKTGSTSELENVNTLKSVNPPIKEIKEIEKFFISNNALKNKIENLPDQNMFLDLSNGFASLSQYINSISNLNENDDFINIKNTLEILPKNLKNDLKPYNDYINKRLSLTYVYSDYIKNDSAENIDSYIKKIKNYLSEKTTLKNNEKMGTEDIEKIKKSLSKIFSQQKVNFIIDSMTSKSKSESEINKINEDKIKALKIDFDEINKFFTENTSTLPPTFMPHLVEIKNYFQKFEEIMPECKTPKCILFKSAINLENKIKEKSTLKGLIISSLSSKYGWLKIFGWILSAILISFGTPVWFDLLNKFSNLRLAGVKPKEERNK
jgi:hypothetical protein